WTEECVDKAQEICYTNQGGVVSTVTPDFSPLQNHLSQKTGRGPRPLSTLQYQNGMRRLAPAPQQAPSVISPTTLPTQPADNWLQSLYSVQWVSNPLGSALTTLALPSVNGPVGRPGIAGGLQWQADPITGEFTPLIQQINDPNNWNDFYYGEVPSRPIPWWGGEGLSLYGNIPGQGWPQDPSYLTYSLGLYSWGQYIAQQRPGFHPWGPYVNGTAGAGLNIAVLDTSAWLQEYINDAGILVGAVHEDLGNILLEGPVIGAAPVQMMFDPFVNQPQRGTAVLGTIAAAVDGVGTDGIAPNALTFFYPTQSVAEGNREELAWFAALVRLKAGDVLVATYPGGSPGTGSTDCILIDRGATLNSFDILEIAENLAVTVVFPLGDNGLDISAALPTLERPNMLFAGASMPSILPRKFWSSNYVGVDGGGGDNVMCSMVPIVTTGGDCNLTRMSIATATDPPNQPSGYISHEMRQRSYTNNFGNTFDGSKAAAAQVAGVAACLQGLSLQFYGAPQPPDDLINILYTSRRIGGGLTAPPNPAWLPADSFGINGDALTGWLYPSDDTVGAPDIGGFTDPAAAGVELVMNPAYEAHPNVQTSMQAMFIRGYYLTGNGMALNNRNDWDYFAGLSEFTFPGEGPNVGEQDDLVPGPLPPTRGGFFGDGIEYPGGEVTDLFVTGLETNKNFINSNGTLALDVQFRITPDTVYESIKEDLDAPAGSVLELTAGFVYSFETETWQEMSYAVSTTDDLNQMINLTYKSPPVDRSLYFGKGGEYYVRSVLYTPSDFGGPGDPFVIYYDFLSLRGDGTTPGPP
ncbi:MAG: hypothetical protein P8M22_13050, partial [Phycisphaerales bacterium]|nr:hypothetical protein [Phycisphaerales bacterium]